QIQIHHAPGVCTIQADGALGQIAATLAIESGLQALENSASVICRVQNCGHLGALGHYALLAAEHGMLGLVFQRTPPLMALPGYAGAAIGNNPIAFACPIPDRPPLVFDMACSVAARGHVLLAAREGRALPEGWALDIGGHPTCDSDAALEGSLLPMAGHKGLGLAMMAECLAGALAGGEPESRQKFQTAPRSGAAGSQTTLIWLVNPTHSGADNFAAYMQEWAHGFLHRGGPEARLPGERAAQREKQARLEGLVITPSLANELEAIGQQAQQAVPWS
ncbi:MAG: Ldh family oxidoreductase, partial [Comamonas sp.]